MYGLFDGSRFNLEFHSPCENHILLIHNIILNESNISNWKYFLAMREKFHEKFVRNYLFKVLRLLRLFKEGNVQIICGYKFMLMENFTNV